jgi:alkylated DNA nucleotide flippase Atl1
MATTPSLRRMWTIYKKLLVEDRMSRRDQALAQAAFYSGARCVLKVLGHLLEDGDVDELHRVIRRHGRTIRVLQGMTPRKRRH